MINNLIIFDYFKSVIKRTYLASPPLVIESEYKENEEHEQTIIDNILEEAIYRGLMILYEYRPRVKLFKSDIESDSTIRLSKQFREKYKISMADIFDVIPYRSAGILVFPVLPQLSPTGRLVYFGLFDYGELARFIAGLKTALTVFGVNPTFTVYLDQEKNDFVIKIFPATYANYQALIFCKINPDIEFDIKTNRINDLGLSGIELQYLIEYVRGVVYFSLGRLRARFGDFLQVGTQTIKQDGEKLLSEAKEIEEKFIEKLNEISFPSLPRWG
ncbi:MAG: hypothetical protein QXR88_01655 [Candidatus Pacearchaeota archaeon]